MRDLRLSGVYGEDLRGLWYGGVGWGRMCTHDRLYMYSYIKHMWKCRSKHNNKSHLGYRTDKPFETLSSAICLGDIDTYR